jgi:hypothetical protein
MATYYVKNGGNNNSAGTSDATAWATISKVNGYSFAAGDTIYFAKGSSWSTECLEPTVSGTAGSVITFDAYGSGALPIIGGKVAVSGWSTSGNWTNQGGNIWSIAISGVMGSTDLNGNSFGRTRIYLNGAEAKRSYLPANINSTDRFSLSTAATTLYVYATSNPATFYSNIERGDNSNSFLLYSHNYLTFNNLDFRGGYWTEVYLSDCNYIIFNGCKIGLYACGSGFEAYGSSHCEVMNCMFDTGDRNMDTVTDLMNSEDGFHLQNGNYGCTYWNIHNNTFKDWGHICFLIWGDSPTNQITDINVYDNYFTCPDIDYCSAFGVKIEPSCGARISIYRNHIYDVPNYSGFATSDLLFYDNIIDGIWGNTYKANPGGYGIACASYSSYAQNQKFYNNTIVNCGDGAVVLTNYGSGVVCQNNEFVNNIFANNGTKGLHYQIVINPYSISDGYNVYQNTFKNNLIYSSATSNTIYYGHSPTYPSGTSYTVAMFNAANGTYDGWPGGVGDVISGNKVGDPLFVSSSDFHLQSSSPAKYAGIATLTSADYDNVTWNSPASVGAYEYDSKGGNVIPTLTTTVVTNITTTTAFSGGSISDDGGAAVTVRGVCWAITSNPTISNSHTSDGSGTGSYSSSITGLTQSTVYHVRAYATNSFGTAYGNDIQFVTATPTVLPTLTTSSATGITYTQVTLGGNISSDGGATVTERGICISTSPNPTTLNKVIEGNTGIGSFNLTDTGLNPTTLYYVRAYAINSVGTAYGNQITFSTTTATVPSITTTSITSITQTTALSGGSITDGGGSNITIKGVCWSLNSNPTISESYTSDGSGSSSWVSSLTGLTANTLYYVRAYATNLSGTGYGDQLSFTTSATIPSLSTTAVTLDITTAISGGNTINDGGSVITIKGVCWSLNSNPTISDSYTSDGSGTSLYSSTLSGLTQNTTYHVRAYATNSIGTGYGSDVQFTTLPGVSWLCARLNKIKHFILPGVNNTCVRTSPVGSDNQTDCINTQLDILYNGNHYYTITYATTGATGATVIGLPPGVTGEWLANVVTISGTPSNSGWPLYIGAAGTWNYTVKLTGGFGQCNNTGTITVTPNNTVTLTSAAGTDAQTVTSGTTITNITYSTTGATGAIVTGLPLGITGVWSSNVVTISGSSTNTGPYTYTITLTGGCGMITTTGVITVV